MRGAPARHGQTASQENGEANTQQHHWVLRRSLKNDCSKHSAGCDPKENPSQRSRPEQDQHPTQRRRQDLSSLRPQRNTDAQFA